MPQDQVAFFVNPTPLFNTLDATKGQIFYAVGLAPKAKAQKGNGTVAVITFTRLVTTGQTKISLGARTKVTAEKQEGTVLKQAEDAIINFSPTSTSSAPLR